MNKNIIIIIIIAILLAIVGFFVLTQAHDLQGGKINTEIEFLSENTLKSGEAVEFVLKDASNNALPNQSLEIKFTENGENQTYSIYTDQEGKGALVLNNEAPGSYDVYVSYNGSTRFEGCMAKTTVTVEEGYVEVSSDTVSSDSDSNETPAPTNSSAGTSLYNGNSASNSQLHYDSQYNFYYDDNGIIRGGQNDGYSAQYIRDIYESGNMTDEDGNLQ
jgi:hypothetical protein